MIERAMNRREAMGTLGGLGAVAGIGMGAGSAWAGTAGPTVYGAQGLGWDAAESKYTLPPLPYGYADLEPHIDEQTMRIHHDRHHQGYVSGLNTALAKLQEIRADQGDPAVLEHWQRKLSFNAGGHVNHTLFWGNMAPEAQSGDPEGPLADAIRRDFGSQEAFEKFFRETAGSVEGSGWAWLVHEPMGNRLMVLQMHNQQHSVFAGVTPLLGVDVWEHAYYLKYQNKRADYVQAFMNVINWPEVQRRYAIATGA
jgi:Fe-Mn family superoxide dismutase